MKFSRRFVIRAEPDVCLAVCCVNARTTSVCVCAFYVCGRIREIPVFACVFMCLSMAVLLCVHLCLCVIVFGRGVGCIEPMSV